MEEWTIPLFLLVHRERFGVGDTRTHPIPAWAAVRIAAWPAYSKCQLTTDFSLSSAIVSVIR
jgi:hypothetical protein